MYAYTVMCEFVADACCINYDHLLYAYTHLSINKHCNIQMFNKSLKFFHVLLYVAIAIYYYF